MGEGSGRGMGRVRLFVGNHGSGRVGSGRVGSGRVGSGRVGSGRVNVSPGWVGSSPRKVTRGQLCADVRHVPRNLMTFPVDHYNHRSNIIKGLQREHKKIRSK